MTTFTRAPTPGLTDRSALLERAFSNDGQPEPPAAVLPDGPGDLAFMRGDMVTARSAYIRRLAVGQDRDAWIGLALVLHRMGRLGDAWRVTQRIEVIAAMGDRIRAITGTNPDALALFRWAASSRGEAG